MQTLSSPKSSFWRNGWFLILWLVGLGWLLPTAAHATHLRAGDIQAKVDTTPTRNPNRIFFKLTLYRDPTKVQQNTIRVYYGDGKTSDLDIPGGIPKTSEVSVSPTANVITFYFEHTYPGSGRYTASMVEANRVAGVINMTASVNQTFYISTTLTVDPGLGQNHLPVLRAPAIDAAAAGQVFLHNPAAYDADGDSLGFRLMQSQQVALIPNPLPASFIPTPSITNGYEYPNSQSFTSGGQSPKQVSFLDNNGNQLAQVGADASLTINRSGQLIWNAPLRVGTYNVAIIVEEWRKNALGYIKIGEVLRDMQIDVVATTNLPPVIKIPQDTCVVAGAVLNKSVTAVDGTGPNAPATPIQLFAYSGIIPPATFRQSTQGPPRAVGRFNWTTACENIAAQPYLVVFKAQDTPRTPPNSNDPPLIDEKTWRVTVVGPAPTNLQAAPTTNQRVLLTWASYPCLFSSQPGVLPTIQIYRRENSYPFTPGPCETGIPAAAGYTRIASIPANLTAYTDDNNGQGLTRGRTYCYRIYVTFPLPAGGASLASNESCATLSGRSAQITNVDVLTTAATNGQIAIKWTQPRPNVGSFNAPLGYRLSRSATGAAPFTLVTTKTSLTDTTYVDSDASLNTQDVQYTYQLVFFSAAAPQPGSAETSETSPLASSVRLNVVPNSLGRQNALTWTYNVPWDNSGRPTSIYRRVGTGTGAFSLLTTVTPSAGATSVTYADQGLTVGETYCYYVQTNGQYATPTNSLGQPILTNLLNRSQQICTVLIPTPCTPVLTVVPTNCDSLANVNQTSSTFDFLNQRYQNRLRWTLGNTPAGCSSDVAYFRIFYRSTADGPFTLIDSTTQYTYLHRVPLNTSGNTGGAGCYVVQAVNAAKVRSALSNVACQDNCVFFLLPNIFTPNGDDINEKFRPKTASPIVRTHIQVFNRWGRKVYESDKDPYINWDGGGPLGETGTSGKVSNGLYYYLAEVEFADFAGTKRTYKGWVEVAR
ncbi:gliding motility-associated C-terminal domain-containing protein [Hymenobacter setariae]|uniref:Gliding motility-associated C-terminal domain-containing protein n=1 Tax=Hymenobacter setariae TaxID=2594794 RepID=A0A558BMT1_9BACT|nr:gliding motility-associated C-terminal domain-containing protein [Hymenobacter setariae]TVT37810.1 gliding motility-associated C-terminal domain-containing protein [Hymenobacter setariae]